MRLAKPDEPGAATVSHPPVPQFATTYPSPPSAITEGAAAVPDVVATAERDAGVLLTVRVHAPDLFRALGAAARPLVAFNGPQPDTSAVLAVTPSGRLGVIAQWERTPRGVRAPRVPSDPRAGSSTGIWSMALRATDGAPGQAIGAVDVVALTRCLVKRVEGGEDSSAHDGDVELVVRADQSLTVRHLNDDDSEARRERMPMRHVAGALPWDWLAAPDAKTALADATRTRDHAEAHLVALETAQRRGAQIPTLTARDLVGDRSKLTAAYIAATDAWTAYHLAVAANRSDATRDANESRTLEFLVPESTALTSVHAMAQLDSLATAGQDAKTNTLRPVSRGPQSDILIHHQGAFAAPHGHGRLLVRRAPSDASPLAVMDADQVAHAHARKEKLAPDVMGANGTGERLDFGVTDAPRAYRDAKNHVGHIDGADLAQSLRQIDQRLTGLYEDPAHCVVLTQSSAVVLANEYNVQRQRRREADAAAMASTKAEAVGSVIAGVLMGAPDDAGFAATVHDYVGRHLVTEQLTARRDVVLKRGKERLGGKAGARARVLLEAAQTGAPHLTGDLLAAARATRDSWTFAATVSTTDPRSTDEQELTALLTPQPADATMGDHASIDDARFDGKPVDTGDDPPIDGAANRPSNEYDDAAHAAALDVVIAGLAPQAAAAHIRRTRATMDTMAPSRCETAASTPARLHRLALARAVTDILSDKRLAIPTAIEQIVMPAARQHGRAPMERWRFSLGEPAIRTSTLTAEQRQAEHVYRLRAATRADQKLTTGLDAAQDASAQMGFFPTPETQDESRTAAHDKTRQVDRLNVDSLIKPIPLVELGFVDAPRAEDESQRIATAQRRADGSVAVQLGDHFTLITQPAISDPAHRHWTPALHALASVQRDHHRQSLGDPMAQVWVTAKALRELATVTESLSSGATRGRRDSSRFAWLQVGRSIDPWTRVLEDSIRAPEHGLSPEAIAALAARNLTVEDARELAPMGGLPGQQKAGIPDPRQTNGIGKAPRLEAASVRCCISGARPRDVVEMKLPAIAQARDLARRTLSERGAAIAGHAAGRSYHSGVVCIPGEHLSVALASLDVKSHEPVLLRLYGGDTTRNQRACVTFSTPEQTLIMHHRPTERMAPAARRLAEKQTTFIREALRTKGHVPPLSIAAAQIEDATHKGSTDWPSLHEALPRLTDHRSPRTTSPLPG